MALRAAFSDDLTRLSLAPYGAGGLDEFTHESLLGLEFLRRADNVRSPKGSLDRRAGDKKLWKFSETGATASKTFGADTKYATIPAAAQLETLDAGFALFKHFKAVRPSAGNTAYILSSRVNGQSYHVLRATIDENGAVTVGFEKTSGGDCAVTTSAITANASTDLLALFDPVGGTFTVYVNGASSGTPVTGLSIADGPIAGTGTAWHIAAHYNPATTSIVANTHFDGALHGFTLLSLRGLRPASGSTTLVDTYIRHSSRVWPAPQAPHVIFHYDCLSTSLTTLTDASRFKNDATVTGTPTNTGGVALGSIPANYVGYVDAATGRGDNVVGSAGRLFYETVRTSTT